MEVIREVTEVTPSEDYDQAVAEWSNIGQDLCKESQNGVSFASLKSISFEESWNLLSARDMSEQKHQVELSMQNVPTDSVFPYCCMPSSLGASLQSQKLTVLAMTKIPLHNEDKLHLRLLKTVFVNLASGRECVRRFGSHWEHIGFQGDDPATDLRGMGIFGLVQLIYLTEMTSVKEKIQQLFSLSQDPVQQFPFCVVGLNISKMVIVLLRKGRLNRLCIKYNDVVSVVNKLYVGAFVKFYKMWKRGKKTIVHSGTVLQDVERYTENNAETILRKLSKKKQVSKSKVKETNPAATDLTDNFHSVVV